MVNHYTVAKKPRDRDVYSPGGRAGMRPDRATIVYANRIRQAYGNVPILLGGVEASLRRFAHYDYWDDRVRNSCLVDAGADALLFGMGERSILRAAKWLEEGRPIADMRVPGTCVMVSEPPEGALVLPAMEEVAADRAAYARAFKTQYDEQDPVRGHALCQKHGKRCLLQNPPDMPLSRQELDEVYALPYERAWHPMYDRDGGVPALAEVKFSIAHVRGCFGPATSAPSPSIRGASSPRAARRPSSARRNYWRARAISRATSTMSAAPRPTSASPPARVSSSAEPARANSASSPDPARTSTPATASMWTSSAPCAKFPG